MTKFRFFFFALLLCRSSSCSCSKTRDFGTGSCCCGCLEFFVSFLAMIFLFLFSMKALSITWEDVIGEAGKKRNDDGKNLGYRYGPCNVGSERPRGGLDDEIIELKKELMAERERKQAVSLELEKERAAADSSLQSAMAMIIKLQSEMSVDRLEARQFRELVEEKQNHDKQVIELLKWMLMNAEDGNKLVGEEGSDQNAPINHIDAKICSSDISIRGDLLSSLKSSLDFDSYSM